MQSTEKRRKKRFEEEDILIKLFNNPVASPKFYLKLIITRKYNHMREEKSKQTEGKKTTLNNIIINMRYV